MPKEHLNRPNQLLSPTPPQQGPVFAVIIVVLIMLAGALFFGMQQIQKQKDARAQLPLIQSGTTTIIIKQSAPTSSQQ